MQANSQQTSDKSQLRTAIETSTALLVLVGLAWYAVLAVSYDEFYRPLGVDPKDVGLSYTNILASSVGAVAVALIAGVLLAPGLAISACLFAVLFQLFRSGGEVRSLVSRTFIKNLLRIILLVLSLTILYVIGLLVFTTLSDAAEAARHVQRGDPVNPVQYRGTNMPRSFYAFPIHADLARVEPSQKADEFPTVAALKDQQLLYLGQANATMVFYDYQNHRALYIPSSDIILKTINCHTSSDPKCKNAFSGPEP